MAECDDRDRRSSIRRVKAANFPRDKWPGDFDFDANPNINPATIHTLATGDWIRKGSLLCLIGDAGTGKSHLLIGLGTAAAEKGDLRLPQDRKGYSLRSIRKGPTKPGGCC